MWSITRPTAQPDLVDVAHSRGTASEAQQSPQPSAALAAVREEVVQGSLAAEQCCPSEEAVLCGAGVCLPGMLTSQHVAASRSRNMHINPGCISLSGFVLGFHGVVGFFFFNVTAVACRCLQASVLTAPGPSIGPTSQTEVSWPLLLTLWCFPVFLSTSAPISKD